MAFGDFKGALTVTTGSMTNPLVATGSVSVAVGDLVFCTYAEQIALTATAVTDNLGNSYTATNAGDDFGAASGRSFYSRVTVAGTLTSVSVAGTASSNDAVFGAAVFEGSFAAPPIDANPANITNDITSPFVGPATGTLAQADELIVAWIAANGGTSGSTETCATGYTTRVDINRGINASASIAAKVVAATTTDTPSWTTSGTAFAADVLGTNSFKKEAAVADVLMGQAML